MVIIAGKSTAKPMKPPGSNINLTELKARDKKKKLEVPKTVFMIEKVSEEETLKSAVVGQDIQISISPKQSQFIESGAFEVLFGGAAGGGKSHGQLVDAMLYALKYEGSNQLILRRTFPDLERSLITKHLKMYPRDIYKYNSSNHRGSFTNGSVIEFGYCDSEKDIYQYQSAEYDVIRFDELTHFTETMYVYMISRLRGVNDFPRHMKSSTNPGGLGHSWVKARFIDPAAAGKQFEVDGHSRIYIPSLAKDNPFLMESDPEYLERLELLSKKERDALLYGIWDLFEGQYFTEWDKKVHVVEPFDIPKYWRKYVVMDYGLDMFACYWIAVDTFNRSFVYREIYTGKDNGGSGVLPSNAANLILRENDPTNEYIAPPDLWNRQKDTGRSIADIFAEHGIYLRKADNSREPGWLNVKEALRVYSGEMGEKTADLRVFDTCPNLIRCMPAVQHDSRNTKDISSTPHELTHSPDAIRYFFAGRPQKGRIPLSTDEELARYEQSYGRQVDDFLNYGR